MKNERLFQCIALVLAITIYIAARFWGLTGSCLWFDEIFSVHAAEQPWNSIFSFIALDLIHPPLFYVVLKFWISMLGDSLFWLRLQPVGFSVIALFPFIALCRELKLGKWTQVLALLLFAVNGSMIKYAQEVRMYSLLLCLSLYSMWLFARYFVKGKSFVPLVIANILLVYTHYFGWLAVTAEVAAIVVYQPIKWRRAVTMFGIAAASFLPWMIIVWTASFRGAGLSQNIGWMSRPGIRALGTFIFGLVEPFHFQASSAEPVSVLRVTIPLLLLFVLAAGIFAVDHLTWTESDRRNLRLISALIALPVGIAFVASWTLPYSIWGTRHLTIVFPPTFILLGMIITSLPRSRLRAAAVTLIVLFAGYAWLVKASRTAPQYSWCAWGSLVAVIPDPPLSPVYTLEDLVAYHIWSAGERRVVKITGVNGIREDRAYFLPRGFNGIETIDIADVSERRFWLAFRGPSTVETEAPLRDFVVKGYLIAERSDIKVGGEDLVLALLEKQN